MDDQKHYLLPIKQAQSCGIFYPQDLKDVRQDDFRDTRLRIFSGTANLPLAQEIACYMGLDLSKINIKRFADGEIYVQLQESVRGCDVFLVQPTCPPANENLMELLVMIDACRRASAKTITAVIPYFGYARADRKTHGRESIAAKLVANLITEAGANRVLACDLHSGQSIGYFDIPVDHVHGQPVILDYLASKMISSQDLVVVSPDVGGVARARAFAKKLSDAPLAIVDKRRQGHNIAETHLAVEHKCTQDLPWLNGHYNSLLAEVELIKEQLQTTEAEHGKLVEKETTPTNVEAVCYKEQQDEEEHDLLVHKSNRQHFQNDIDECVALVASLKACTAQKNLSEGIKIHTDILKRGLLKKNVFVGSTLVNMYAKCGALEIAQKVFDELPAHNVVLWNTLIAGYAQQGHDEKALMYFEQMLCEGISPDAITFVCVLKVCGISGAANKGHELHTRIIAGRLLEEDEDSVLGNALIGMYAKCGLLGEAQEVFDKLLVRNVVSWNTLIAGYAQHGQSEEALNCHKQMKLWGFSPNAITFVSILRACGIMRMKGKGQELHVEIVRDGMLEQNIHVGTALVDMYARCASLAEAQEVFDELPVRNIFSWTALINGYIQHGHGERALNCFDRAQHEGFSSNAITFVCALKACGSIGASGKGQELHAKIVKEGSFENETVVGTALVDMYANCGMLVEAQKVFDKMSVRDVVSWTALMGGYAQYGQGERAFKCFEQMHLEGVPPNIVSWNALIAGRVQYGHSEEAYNCFQRMQLEGFSPDYVTFACLLKTCCSIGAAEKGLELHSEIIRKGLLNENFMIANALVDVYAKNGMLAEAQAVFDKLQSRDVVSWNSLMSGYALLANDVCVISLFDQMVGEGQKPDLVTFTIMLNACSHRGLLDMGQMYFENINKSYGMVPTLEHHTCMVDLFGRAGHLDKVLVLIEEMPFSTDMTIWHTLLSACVKLGNINLGRWAFEQASLLNGNDAAAYVCVSNVVGSLILL